MKRIMILGSTGSIGRQAIDILSHYPDRFAISALSAGRNAKLLAEQANALKPQYVAIADETKAEELRDALAYPCEIFSGKTGIMEMAGIPCDMALVSIVGAAGLEATLTAIRAGTDIALANKETLVAGGALVMGEAVRHGIDLLPVDSEHSAILQCLRGVEAEGRDVIDTLYLTASGGPFRGYTAEQLGDVTPEQALKHPNWNMGAKITIDSATLMNKGLEVIEARWLFDVPPEKIRVLVHPQSIIHSMVGFRDGAVMAQLGLPDMRGPILYALNKCRRLDSPLAPPDFAGLGTLTFDEPDLSVFPCLGLAYRALDEGGTMPAVMNAANEIAVALFLDRKIPFHKIPGIIEKQMDEHNPVPADTLDVIREADRETRERVLREYHCSAN